MTTYYLDASAIVKRYLHENGSQWVTALWQRTGEVSLFSGELVDVEVVCALSRARREGRIGMKRRNASAALFILEVQEVLESISVSAEIRHSAHRLALRHPLRAYDAVHLATALALEKRLRRSGISVPVFISADANLLAAARVEGLMIENPNEHE